MAEANQLVMQRLRQIAEALDIPVERFFEATPIASLEGAGQFASLWFRLRTPAGRVAALEALEEILDGEA